MKDTPRKSISFNKANTPFQIGAGADLALICGPCALESLDHALFLASSIKKIVEAAGFSMIFKGSFDKANRTSVGSFRGVGQAEGLEILSKVKNELGLAVATDIHEVSQVANVSEVVDLLQIPAFLCRQTDLLLAAGATEKPTMIKKGQFLAPADMAFAAEKVMSAGSAGVMCCERGSCFGYRDLIVDYRSLMIMREFGHPVVFDATHSVQQMGGASGKSGGDRKFVSMLARAAVAVGIDALFLECHQDPDSAPSDGPNMLTPEMLKSLLVDLRKLSDLKLN